MKQITLATASYYRYNLYDEIGDFNGYADFIEDLATASEQDKVAIYINSPGGRLDVGVSLVNAINTTRATVTAVVEGPSYSMASILALACDDLLMLDNTFLMFHNYSTGNFGKGGELMGILRHNDDHFNKMMRKVCYPFLTKREIEKISSDQDIYIYNDDKTLETRKGRHFK